MSELNTIVDVVISRATQAVARSAFGTLGIVAEFPASKTMVTFDRYREYASLAEMDSDGWSVTDPPYDAAVKAFSQDPQISKIMVGRKDSTDATWAAALNEIAAATSDWYIFCIVTGEDGVEADIPIVLQDYKDVAVWTSSTDQKKLFSIADSDVNIYDSGSTTDIAYYLNNVADERSFVAFHATPADYMEAAWPGECLPFDPGSQTWAYKTISGVTPDILTSGQASAVLAKKGNIYTTTAGVNVTQNGTVASGEFIDVMRGIDWLTSLLMEDVFTNLVNVRKVPYDDTGITMIGGTVQGSLAQAERAGVLIPGSSVVTLPKYADIPTADKIARNLPDVNFTALIQGAIQTIEIRGVVTV